MKKFLIVFLLLTAVVFAKNVEDRLITLELDSNGKAHIVEEYTISFSTTSEISDFKALAGVNELSAWKNFLDSIEPAFFGNKTYLQVVSKVDSLGFGRVLLDYYSEDFAKPVNESGRFLVRGVLPDQITFYNAEIKVLTIPSKTTMQFMVTLPKAELFEVEKYMAVFPTALFNGPYVDQKAGEVTYIIRGPASASGFVFSYTIEKGIGEWDIQKVLDTIYTWAFTNPVYTLVILVIIVLVTVYRKEISALVSESFGGEEDIEMPRKEL